MTLPPRASMPLSRSIMRGALMNELWLTEGLVPTSSAKCARSRSGTGCKAGEPNMRRETTNLLLQSSEPALKAFFVRRPLMNAMESSVVE